MTSKLQIVLAISDVRTGGSATVRLHRGDVVRVDRSASVQFASAPFAFQVEDIDRGSAPDGWAWLAGYQLDKQRRPRRRRVILVRPDGLRPIACRTRPDATPLGSS